MPRRISPRLSDVSATKQGKRHSIEIALTRFDRTEGCAQPLAFVRERARVCA
jgi:hypothetical protein